MSLRTRWLHARVDDWAAKGLITGAQAEAIRADLAREADASRAAPFTILASLGGLCVALGIILVIAYNWEKFHRGWKLGGFLVLVAATAEAYARIAAARATVAKAAVALLWLMLPLAGIGLWAQVYQLSGDGFRPLLVWLILSLPLVWFSRDSAVAVVHAIGLVFAIFVGTFDSDAAVGLVKHGGIITPGGLLGIFGPSLAGLVLLWAYAAAVGRWQLGSRARLWLLVAGLVWAWSLAVGDTPFELHDTPAQFAICASLVAAYWGLRGLAGGSEGSAELGVLGVAVAFYAMTFFWHAHPGSRGLLETVPLGYAKLLVAAGCLLGVRARGSADETPALRWVLRGLVLLPVVLAVLLVAREWYRPVAVGANLGLVALCGWLMADGVRRGVSTRINLGTTLLGILIMTRFLDYFGTMLQSGVAFIAAGVMFIGLAWALNRGRRELISRAGVKP